MKSTIVELNTSVASGRGMADYGLKRLEVEETKCAG